MQAFICDTCDRFTASDGTSLVVVNLHSSPLSFASEIRPPRGRRGRSEARTHRKYMDVSEEKSGVVRFDARFKRRQQAVSSVANSSPKPP